jgi:hypothetical protein
LDSFCSWTAFKELEINNFAVDRGFVQNASVLEAMKSVVNRLRSGLTSEIIKLTVMLHITSIKLIEKPCNRCIDNHSRFTSGNEHITNWNDEWKYQV